MEMHRHIASSAARLAAPFSLRVSRQFRAAATDVFDAFLQPRTACHFLFATPRGEMVTVEMDAHIGGAFLITERRDGEEVAHTGTYLELDRPHRLCFSFCVPKFSAEHDRVLIDIAPRGGGSFLTLTHLMRADQSGQAEQARRGWTQILEGLATTLQSPHSR